MATNTELVTHQGPARVQLDALPYLDNEYEDPDMQAYVKQLIEDEMASMPPRDYLAHLPPPPETMFDKNPELQGEMERVAAQQPMQPMDVSRYEVPQPPKELQRDQSSWRRSVNNARAQLEHQRTRLMNLELLQRYGPQAWLQHNKALDTMKGCIEKDLHDSAKQAEDTNLKRKVLQERSGPKLGQSYHDYHKRVQENQEINNACALLRQDIKRLKTELASEGVEVDAEVEVNGGEHANGSTGADTDVNMDGGTDS